MTYNIAQVPCIVDMNLGKFGEMVRGREVWSASVHRVTVGHDWVTEQQHFSKTRVMIRVIQRSFMSKASKKRPATSPVAQW